jgi:hypothetical protein
MRLRLFRHVTLGLGLCITACGSSSSPPPDTAKQAVTDAGARIEGNWTLLNFQPSQPLEPMFQQFLAAQLHQLVVSFHAGTMHVEGPGVSTDRAFNITSAAADGFSAVITDPTNVVYQVKGLFEGQQLAFTSLTDPWRGQGKLQRAP